MVGRTAGCVIPTERIQIIVEERGTRVVNRRLRETGQRARASAGGVNLLRTALAALGGVAVVRQLIQTADAFTNIQNRLRLVTDGVGELNAVTRELLRISNETRSSFETNAELFNRLALSTRQLGLSQQDVLDFTQSLNEAVILSGASAQEANAGLIQLSQGLASGALRGDELRSVLEQLPAVADVIAEGLGVTRGELRELGAQGRITAEAVVDAFAQAREELGERFGTTVPTVGQAFQVLRNQAVAFIGGLNEANGITAFLSRGLTLLAENIELVARVLGGVGLAAALALATSGVIALTAAIAANPIGFLITALTVGIGLLTTFSDQIIVSSDGITSLRDVAIAAFEAIVPIVQAAGEAVFDFISSFVDSQNDLGTTLSTTINNVAGFIDRFIGFFVGLGSAVGEAARQVGLIIVDTLGVDIVNDILGAFEGLLDGLLTIFQTIGDTAIRIFNEVRSAFNDTFDAFNLLSAGEFELASEAFDRAEFRIGRIGAAVTEIPNTFQRNFEALRATDLIPLVPEDIEAPAESFGAAVGQSFLDGFNSSTAVSDFVNGNFITGIINRAREIAQQRIADQAAAANQPEVDLSNAPAGGGTGNAVEAAFTSQDAVTNAVNQLTRSRIDLAQAELQLNDEVEKGNITRLESVRILRDLENASLASSTSVSAGFTRGLNNIANEITDFASLTEEALGNAFSGAEDALVQFVQTGELSFSGLVDSILADLTRLLARQAISGLLGSLGGGLFGGTLFGNALSSFAGARQNGGDVQPGRQFLVGERGPELFTPGERGTITPMAAPAPPPEVNVSVVNVTDPNEVAGALTTPAGERAILNVIRRNPRTLRELSA